KKAMTPTQQVTFEHALHRMLAQHFDYSAVAREFTALLVFGERLFDPELLRHFIDRVESIRGRFVRAENAKRFHVRFHHVAQERPQGPHVTGFGLPWLVELSRVITEIRQ